MRILIATGIYPPDIGGPATVSKILAEELPKIGINTKVLTFGKVRHLPPIIRHIIYFFKILKLGRKIDLIFAQDPLSVGLPSALAAIILRKKFIVRVGGDFAWEQGKQRFGIKELLDDFYDKKYGWRVELMRTLQRFVGRRAKMIIVPSFYLKKLVTRWGIEENKIKVIYNTAKKIDFTLDKNKAKKELSLDGDIILSVGRLVPCKGFDLLIDLMPELLNINPRFRLIIVGDGPEKKIYESQIKDSALEKYVKLIGKLEQIEVWKYMRASDMFVLNTGCEGMSHLVIEAMQIELPVITTNIGGNPEVVENNKTGLIVEYNNKVEIKNAIIKLWRNKQLANELSKNAKFQFKEKFGKQIMINNILKLLNKQLVVL